MIILGYRSISLLYRLYIQAVKIIRKEYVTSNNSIDILNISYQLVFEYQLSIILRTLRLID